MGASSVTGVSGVGAGRLQKGPGNGRNQYQPLASPNIVAAGFVTAGAGGDITVPLSGMTAAAAGLAVFVSGQVTASASLCKSKADVGGVLSSFVITASGAGLIAWMVVKP
jgi:hypothetical protein